MHANGFDEPLLNGCESSVAQPVVCLNVLFKVAEPIIFLSPGKVDTNRGGACARVSRLDIVLLTEPARAHPISKSPAGRSPSARRETLATHRQVRSGPPQPA